MQHVNCKGTEISEIKVEYKWKSSSKVQVPQKLYLIVLPIVTILTIISRGAHLISAVLVMSTIYMWLYN